MATSDDSSTGGAGNRLLEGKEVGIDPSPSQTTGKQKRYLMAPFHFVSGTEIGVLVVGVVFALGAGAAMPGFISIFGDMMAALNTNTDMVPYAKLLAILGVVALFCGWVAAGSFEYLCDRQAGKFKLELFSSILRQELGWFDTHDAGALSSQIDSNTATIRTAVGLKCATALQFFSTCVGGFVVAFWRSWKMTLIVSATLPCVAAGGAFLAWALRYSQTAVSDAYREAGSVAEEALGNIRTVISLGGEDRLAAAYTERLKRAEKAAIKGGVFTGSAFGAMMACVFLMYALGFWYAGQVISDGLRDLQAAIAMLPGTTVLDAGSLEFQGGDAIVVLICVMVSAFSIGQIIPLFGDYMKAVEAANDLLEIINRKSQLDPLDESGLKDVNLTGDIVYENVTFAYPSRPEKTVLKDLNLRIPAGKSVALVGGSGCGKSTIVQLLQRQYEPSAGTVRVGNTPLKEINLATLREGLGVVSQEPRLFSATVEENIALGSRSRVTHAEVEAAAQKANAAGFISDFAEKYETHCGSRGSQLSGGQKQRVAIARALIRHPSILIFDEATSALDNASERVVQAALDRLIESTGVTTIIIAHRLSTIRRADLIVVLGQRDDAGGSAVVQQGSHEELMKDESGLYFSLVQSQLAGLHGGDEEKEEEASTEVLVETTTNASVAAAQSMEKHPSFPLTSRRDSVTSSISRISEHLLGTDVTDVTRRCLCLKKKVAPRDPHAPPPVSKSRIFGLALRYWPVYIVTLIAAACSGAVFPAYSVMFSRFIAVFFRLDPDEVSDEANKWALAFVCLAISTFVIEWVKFTGIEYMGSKVTADLRSRAFLQTIHQDVAFFDDPKNSVGESLSSKAAEAKHTRKSV
ncbi:ATP-binding cassette transporter ABC.B1 [Toxoplasma gondii TgCatPRC2]|uniref:ATP-binding cassette transporter ABC.B1 n=1 Tax=Toxoplasma gondii TgCatPRC2 TaxID=1130821 RepID=A0A151HLY6_TOXGO|nr:ATP-binding cassette transporter ABC.B1 [Toxoplasma gondii TgCatPRC2]